MNDITLLLNADNLILNALREDIPDRDISTDAIIGEYTKGQVDLICKQDGILAGLEVFKRVFRLLDENTRFETEFKDGDSIFNGQKVCTVTSDIRVLLSGERTALNYLQRMCGIATYTRQIVQLLNGTGIKLVDTRKTTPNMRVFEKYAVTVGGGFNHRSNLSDGVMLKDNHISAAGGIKEAVTAAKSRVSFVRKIEVEVETLDMVREAIDAKADIIMLDNMSVDQMRQAIEIIDKRAEIECSGNITHESAKQLRDLDIDYISSGALTHSAPILDLSLKNLHRI